MSLQRQHFGLPFFVEGGNDFSKVVGNEPIPLQSRCSYHNTMLTSLVQPWSSGWLWWPCRPLLVWTWIWFDCRLSGRIQSTKNLWQITRFKNINLLNTCFQKHLYLTLSQHTNWTSSSPKVWTKDAIVAAILHAALQNLDSTMCPPVPNCASLLANSELNHMWHCLSTCRMRFCFLWWKYSWK